MSPPRADASRLDRFRYEYGAEPLHLLATVASLSIALYAVLRIFEIPSTAGILLWLVGAIVFHDFIALPLYSLFLRIAEEGADAAIEPRRRALITLNHIRIPVAFSALLLLISFPLVFQIDEPRYRLTLGFELTLDRYLGNWLLITGALFLISGLLYALKIRSKKSRAPMFARESRQHPIAPPSKVLVLVSRGVLAILALFAAWVAALVIYGVFNSFPL